MYNIHLVGLQFTLKLTNDKVVLQMLNLNFVYYQLVIRRQQIQGSRPLMIKKRFSKYTALYTNISLFLKFCPHARFKEEFDTFE